MDERNLCLHELFERQAQKTPDATAVVDAETKMTYAELDRRANTLAAHLRKAGVVPDVAVGVYMERCAEYVVAILAAMKAGGAFVPLELAYPPSQLEDVLSDCQPNLVLTKEDHAGRLPDWQESFRMDVEEPETGETSEPIRVDRENLAFIPYSSGTTGKPKGIANPHRAPVLSYLWRYGISDYGPDDRVGCSVFFVWEVLRPLLRGGASYVIGDDVIYDPPALVRYLEEHRITEIQMTSSLTEAVLDASGPDLAERLPDLQTVWVCGEVVTKTLARRLLEALPHVRSYNLYSIAETHEVAVTELGEALDHPESTYCPVGRPASPDRLYILDDELQRVSEGEPGEVVVGGEMLARGFVNLPEKTAERFVPDPFAGEEGEAGARMYRTGDRGRILSDGQLEILGRADFRVRIRGYNVELGAVEAAIEEHLAVRACVVVSEGEEGEDKRLVAYVVPETKDDHRFSDWSIDPKTGRSKEIRGSLRDALPHYAVPAVYVVLDALPIQATSGKVDRKKLPPSPPRQARTGGEVPTETLSADAPRPEKEMLLKRIWEETLRLDEGEVEADDNFFDLGGHSLAAAQLSSRVEDGFNVHVSMPLFMEDPTVKGLCDRIEALQRDESEAALPPEIDLRAEAVLEPEISPEGGGTKDLRDAGNVFLTGATGFLGAFLLDGLLSATDASVHCLVRPREDEDPIDTIASNLETYGLPTDRMDRVVAVAGDLGEPLLGMSGERFDSLAREADLVVHAAAAVNLVYPYSALKAPNVGGTREALRLACRHRSKPFHFISTDGIFPPNSGVGEEDTDLDSLADAREDGYGQSKWVAEKLVREAEGRGLPVCVYRPGFISGHSETGASNPRDLQGAVLSESLRLGAAPEIVGWRLEMTPVNFVVAAILDSASKPEALGGVYHLANPDPVPAATVFDWLEEGGYALERLPYEEWSNRLESAPPEEENGPGSILSGAAPAAEDLSDGNVYDDRNTRRILGKDGPRRPNVDRNLILNYARYFSSRGWTPAPSALQGASRRR